MKIFNLSLKLSVLLICSLSSFLIAAERPNVLFIMSDDHTTQAIGVYGSRLAKLNPTPNIDPTIVRFSHFPLRLFSRRGK